MKSAGNKMKILKPLMLLWILALCAACLFACADGGEAESTLESESGSESESVEPWGEISFRTLTVQGTRVQGTVPHETESFSFREEIVTEGDARYRHLPSQPSPQNAATVMGLPLSWTARRPGTPLPERSPL